MRFASLLLIAGVSVPLAAGTACRATSPEAATLDGTELTMADLPVKVTAPVAGTFDQAIDHASAPATDPSPTFKQRYWYTKEFAQGPDSPVLYYIGGEGEVNPSYFDDLADTAKVLHASIVLLEHRYYGESMPFATPTVDQMKYLTIHDALEDLASFEAYAKGTLGLGGKWIAVGGSYPGMLAAFYRQKHPELVVGAWASSAPVNVQTTFWGYDAVASRALGSECTLLFQQVLAAAGAIYDDPAKLAVITAQVFGQSVPAEDFGDKVEFEDYLSTWIEGSIQYGQAEKVCSALEQHRLSPIDGFLGFIHPPLTPDDDADAGGAPVVPPVPPARGRLGASHADVRLGPGGGVRAPDDDGGDPGIDSWSYQTCAEVGFFQSANPDRTQSILASGVDGTRDIARCQKQFGRVPDVAKTRAEYYQPLLDGQASNIFFANGTWDPWSSLGFTDPESPPPGGNTVFVVEHGSHCSELFGLKPTSPLATFEAHKAFAQLAKQWLAATP